MQLSLQAMAGRVEQGISELNERISRQADTITEQRKRLDIYKELAPVHVSASVDMRMGGK